MSGRIRVEWPELDRAVLVDLADDLNPELCQELRSHLPFTVTQEHPVVSGSSLTCWVSYLSKAPMPVTESIVDAPVGRLRFSQKTGSKISIQYGPGLEPVSQGVLGLVRPEDIAALPTIGELVWNNLMWGKKVLRVRYTAEDDEPGEVRTGVSTAHPLAVRIEGLADSYSDVEPPDLVAIRTGQIEDAGSFGQYFSVIDAANGLVRDLTVHTLYPLYRALDSEAIESVLAIYHHIVSSYRFTLGYHGYRELSDLLASVGDAIDADSSPETVRRILEALLCYTNRLYSWSHHNFPWHLSRGFPKHGSGEPAGSWEPPRSPD
ncbi:MAG: DUF3830 domain-containing protein [Acidimicrobiia bacterium]|nr:DUF3830 domain-containing protein [Acidimicrobiia bacterium]